MRELSTGVYNLKSTRRQRMSVCSPLDKVETSNEYLEANFVHNASVHLWYKTVLVSQAK